MNPLWAWLFPLLMLLGFASMGFWFTGLLAEARAHPDRTFFNMRGINPFNGPRGLVELARVPRRRYVRAGLTWIAYFVVWSVLVLTTFGSFLIIGVIIGVLIAAWLLYSILTARSQLSAAEW
jgi:hypothetical protein